MPRVLLADDHTLVRTGIRALLEAAGNLEVVGEASDGRAAVELVRTLNPDLAIIDVAMPNMNGIEAVRQICADHPHTRVIMLSMHSDQQYIYEALRCGAAGYVLKDAAFTELVSAIQTVLEGKTYLSPPLADSVMTDYVRRAQGKTAITELDKLSSREREVLQLIGEGNSSAEIAKVLFISVRTVETHRQHIMEKLNIHSIAELTKFAIRHGICSL